MLAAVPVLELVDETFVAADARAVATAVRDPLRWAEWWPDLALTPFMDRGELGIRWSAVGRAWVGSVELWLEAVGDGVLVHHYLRLDPVAAAGAASPRRIARERHRRALSWKRAAFALKDTLEGSRRPGTSVHPDGSSPAPDLPTMGG